MVEGGRQVTKLDSAYVRHAAWPRNQGCPIDNGQRYIIQLSALRAALCEAKADTTLCFATLDLLASP